VDGRRVADAITWLRLLVLPCLWWFALAGAGRVVGIGLLLAGLTDFLDGFVARRLGQASSAGARLDLIADTLLLLSAAIWLELLRPEIARDNSGLVATTFLIYFVSVAVGLLKFHRLPNLHLYSSKFAGGLLYAFAVITMLTGTYDRLLLGLAAGALLVSSAEMLVGQLMLSAPEAKLGTVLLVRSRRHETSMVQAIGSARKQRSQAPTANVVGSNASPTGINPIAAAPRQKDRGP
jgi:phosphatidylglycerophosphate synthase